MLHLSTASAVPEPDSYHGYGATDMYAVDPQFGTPADLRARANALHWPHMKFVLDMVPNHIGPKDPWVTDEPDWFHGTVSEHHKAVDEFAPLVNPARGLARSTRHAPGLVRQHAARHEPGEPGVSLGQGRGSGRGRVLVAINKSAVAKTTSIETQEAALAGCTYTHPVLGGVTNDGEQLTLPPGAGLVYWTRLLPTLLR